MINLIQKITQYVTEKPSLRLRPAGAHYASSATGCLRSLFWSEQSEPITDPRDMAANIRMLMGDYIEKGMLEQWIKNMGVVDVIHLGSQVGIGDTNPTWNGYIDWLLAAREGEQFKPFVVEVKTKWGVGAEILMKKLVPDEAYVIQLGCYLDQMKKHGFTNEGCLLFVCVGDKCPPAFIQFDVKVIDNWVLVERVRTETVDQKMDLKYDFTAIKQRLLALDEYKKTGKLPPCDYEYQYDINSAKCRAASYSMMESAARGSKVIGDWQCAYCPYLTKCLKIEGKGRDYTPSEMVTLKSMASTKRKQSYADRKNKKAKEK